jgi:hypothetical protein
MMPDEVKQAIDELNDRLAELFDLQEILALALEQFDLEECCLKVRLRWLLSELQGDVSLLHEEISFYAGKLISHTKMLDRPQPGEPLDR